MKPHPIQYTPHPAGDLSTARRDDLALYSLTERGSGLVDLLVARRRSLGAHLYRSARVLEVEVIGLGAVPDQARLILGIAGVGCTLYPDALVGVVARARDIEQLVNISALGILLDVLANPIIEVFLVEEEKAVLLEALYAIFLAFVPVLGKGHRYSRNYWHCCQLAEHHYASHTHTSYPRRTTTRGGSLTRINNSQPKIHINDRSAARSAEEDGPKGLGRRAQQHREIQKWSTKTETAPGPARTRPASGRCILPAMGEGKVWVGPSREGPDGQLVIRETSLPGRDHYWYVYVLRFERAGSGAAGGSRRSVGRAPAMVKKLLVTGAT